MSLGQLDEVEPALDAITKAPPPPGRFFDGSTSGPQAAGVVNWRTVGSSATSAVVATPPSRHFLRRRSVPLGLGSQGAVGRFELLARRCRRRDLESGTGACRDQRDFVDSSVGLFARPACSGPDRRRRPGCCIRSCRGGTRCDPREGIDGVLDERPDAYRGGRADDRAGRIDEAIDELSRGLELAARGSGPTETACGQIWLARALTLQGDRQQAKRMLAEARWTVEASLDPGPVVKSGPGTRGAEASGDRLRLPRCFAGRRAQRPGAFRSEADERLAESA